MELLLSAEPQLAGELAGRLPGPARAGPRARRPAPTSRDAGGLAAHPGQRKTIAHALGVHPQTVRYRIARLRELFGTALDDPDGDSSSSWRCEPPLRRGRRCEPR